MIYKAFASSAAGVLVWFLLRERAESWVAGVAVAVVVLAAFRFLPPRPHTTFRRDALIATAAVVTGALAGWVVERWL